MHVSGSGSDGIRVSLSSAHSASSRGSSPDDCDTTGVVYTWGDVFCSDAYTDDGTCSSNGTNVLIPRLLVSNAMFDVHHAAFGLKHAALVTRQGEVFTWGEESGGQLGHGVDNDMVLPCLVESLATSRFEFVACGEFHTCAITVTGELYTWDDGSHNVGALGHISGSGRWTPKRLSGIFDGFQVSFVSCGPWHAALLTSSGMLFTLGDGTFGALGHGDRESVSYPKEVDSLSGLRTIAVSCGVWHTAAVAEIIVTQSNARISSGKLFTWGDGDKYRLGQGDEEPRLKPTCVPFLVDHNVHKVACGQSLTVVLTTAGHVFTMGCNVYGQLGNPLAEGKLPCLVEDGISEETVEEIACGAYHVAVLTSANEVFTWGKGASGRLGHGDVQDRKVPTLVEGLKDKLVKLVTCGANCTAAICFHKQTASTEQSQCSLCRQTFGFTRKRHNCYNCGLVHCHSCSSKKAAQAALAPNPSKPYRVCDSCFLKLNKGTEANNNNRRSSLTRVIEGKVKVEKSETKWSKVAIPSNIDLIKFLDSKAIKQGKKSDTLFVGHSFEQHATHMKEPNGYSGFQYGFLELAQFSSGLNNKTMFPFSTGVILPHSATSFPTRLSSANCVTESLRKTNEILKQEITGLREQVEILRKRCDHQELELQKSVKNVHDAMTTAADESSKVQVATNFINSLIRQLKDSGIKLLPPGIQETKELRLEDVQNGSDPIEFHPCDTNRAKLKSTKHGSITQNHSPGPFKDHQPVPNGRFKRSDAVLSRRVRVMSDVPLEDVFSDTMPTRDVESENKPANVKQHTSSTNDVPEWIERYAPGVYVTLATRHGGAIELRKVRFSRKMFQEQQADIWWAQNRQKVYRQYGVQGAAQPPCTNQGVGQGDMSPSQP